MSTAVNEPYLLSSYVLPKRFKRPSSKPLPNVYATHQQASTSSAEGYVTVAAQGDGVHILDLSTLHPVVSHTLGPSSAFTCPPASRVNGRKTSTTYAVLESAQGVKADDHGKTVRMWRDNASGESDAAVTVQTVTLPHRVSRVSIQNEIPDTVLFVGENGEISVTDQDLALLHSYNPEQESQTVDSFVFSRSEAVFVPRRLALQDGAVIVSVQKSGESTSVRLAGIDRTGIKILGGVALPPKLVVLRASCSAAGFMSVLTPSGEWHCFQIECLENSNFALASVGKPMTLRNLTFPSESATSFGDEISLLSLGSSHVLLAGVSSPSSELTLLVWDLQYSVVLASRTLAIPSTITRTKKQGIRLQLSGSSGSTTQAILTLSPATTPAVANGEAGSHPAADDSSQRSSVLVIPLAVPVVSSVANALGRAPMTEKWTVHASTNVFDANLSHSNLEASQVKLMRAMRTAMEQKRVEAADELFFNWISQQEGGKAPGGRANKKLHLGYQFVKQTLEIILRTTKNASTDIPYSPKIMRYLMQQRCVSAGMIEGGLFAALRLRNDWESMLLALKTVIDIPETDVVGLLHSSAVAARQAQSDSAMQVDAGADSSVPPLTSVLALCATYTMSAPALRLAIRQQLTDAAELTVILQVLYQWIDAWCAEDVTLLPERTKKDLHGALVPVLENKQKGTLPPLEKVLTFLQTLLDSSFLTFLTYPPSHPILRDIFSHLEPELEFTDDVEQLRGPLEPFVRAHAKAVHEAAHGVQKPDLKVDWRKRRKEAHEQAGMTVGAYQIEEIIL